MSNLLILIFISLVLTIDCIQIYRSIAFLEEQHILSEKKCTPLPQLPHLDWSTDERFYNTTVYPICHRFYKLSRPDFRLFCTGAEEWNYSVKEIEDLSCDCRYWKDSI